MRLLSIIIAAAMLSGSLAQVKPFGDAYKKAVAALSDQNSPDVPRQLTRPEELRFKEASFTFVRVQYNNDGPRAAPRASGGWRTDYPQADLNFVHCFQEITKFKTDLNPIALKLTAETLKNYPFLYLVKGGQLQLTPDEVRSLRAYLLGGGFLMIDDFWGDADWQNLVQQFKQVFPDREPKELPPDHAIFRSFYDIKEKPQVLSITSLMALREGRAIPESSLMARYLGLTDDHGRLMVLFCHNNDLGDGWERVGYDELYDQEYSNKRAFPMGINIVVYVLTTGAAN